MSLHFKEMVRILLSEPENSREERNSVSIVELLAPCFCPISRGVDIPWALDGGNWLLGFLSGPHPSRPVVFL
jgi:hypothetical protein